MSIKDRRKALGITRAQLAAYAYVDARIAQLVEMGVNHDADCIHRLEATLTALEGGQQPPAWKDQVETEIAASGHHKLTADNDDSDA